MGWRLSGERSTRPRPLRATSPTMRRTGEGNGLRSEGVSEGIRRTCPQIWGLLGQEDLPSDLRATRSGSGHPWASVSHSPRATERSASSASVRRAGRVGMVGSCNESCASASTGFYRGTERSRSSGSPLQALRSATALSHCAQSLFRLPKGQLRHMDFGNDNQGLSLVIAPETSTTASPVPATALSQQQAEDGDDSTSGNVTDP